MVALYCNAVHADLVGPDLSLTIHETVRPIAPEPLPYLKEIVASGKLGIGFAAGGRKTRPSCAAACSII
jgi:3-hydroxybutyryl-CoA dehydrogenase